MPIPTYGFDPTETSVPWKKLRRAGFSVKLATPFARRPVADRRMLSGEDLPILFRKSLMAEPEAVSLYYELEASPEFHNTISYDAIRAENYTGLFLPGGHDKGMREYLDSPVLQKVIARFFELGKPVGAICHGTLLAARSKLGDRSVLWGKKTTGLTRRQEMLAYQLTRWTLGDYYRTFPTPMADELKSYLRSPADFDPGPGFPVPFKRDSDTNLRPGFTVRDGNYLSARWPGDAHRFGDELVGLFREFSGSK